MAVPTLNSVSPQSGPPGTAVVCLGAGFDPGAQVGCPALVETTFVSVGEVRAAIPADLVGPAGGSFQISVYVRNEDGAISAVLPFTVTFGWPSGDLQSWTSIEAVCGEVPGFRRGAAVSDAQIQVWMRSVAQSIAGAMLRRGLSLDPAQWQQPDAGTAMPAASGLLELVNRLGAAAQLAAVVGGQFTQGEWGLAKTLERRFEREMKALAEGGYDKLFRPAAATVESGRQAYGGDIGDASPAFSKDQVF
ncbi:MAG: IPT/TIG domain-containing protein [Rhodospirillales bacterium]